MWSRFLKARKQRKGNYTMLMTLILGVLMGFGALSMDVSLMRLGQSQAQDLADAAAHAAVVVLKNGGDSTKAKEAAQEVIASNTIVGVAPTLVSLTLGTWDGANQSFTEGAAQASAVQAEVGLVGDNSLPLLMGPIFGWTDIEVRGRATAATKSLQVILVMDVTGSWKQSDFANARTAAVAFLDVLHENHTEDDLVGMTVFHQRYGWEFTPFTSIAQSAADSTLVRDKWSAMNIATYAGIYRPDWAIGANFTSKHIACQVYGTAGTGQSPGWCSSGASCFQPANKNNYAINTVGGCFPNMPRYYSDEPGTDHTTGMEMARTMFNEQADPLAYKAMVVMTDGKAGGYLTSTGLRDAAGYVEPFREFRHSGPHTMTQIENDTVALANQMHNDQDVNIWFISFVETKPFMAQSAQGDGWYVNTTSSAELKKIFEEIARSLPIAIVN